MCDGEREPRLARPACAGERHEPDVLAPEQRLDGGDARAGARRAASPAPAAACAGPCGRRVAEERRILLQDRAFELLQRRAGLDAQLVDERTSRLAIGVERLLLPPGAVQREDLLLAQTLPVRLLREQPLELGDQRVVPAEREGGVVPELDRS